MRALALLFVLMCSSLSAAGCSMSQPCSAIGCVDGFTISLQKATTPWEAGTYQVDIDADGKKITCTTKLPLAASDPSPSSCTDASVLLGVSGSALPAAQQSLSDIILKTTPAQVTVTVTRDGAMIGNKEFTPPYQSSEPNGPECGPICTNASDNMPIS